MIGAFIISLLFTPVVGFIVAALSGKAVRNEEFIELQQEESEIKIQQEESKGKVDSHIYHQEMEKLRNMFNDGKISEMEYEEARKRFEDLHS